MSVNEEDANMEINEMINVFVIGVRCHVWYCSTSSWRLRLTNSVNNKEIRR